MADLDLQAALDFALDATWNAGRISLGYFQSSIEIETKADQSPVTIADRLTEQRLREMISRAYPDHGIIGEEYGDTRSGQRYTWVIDPIDGTKSFVCGVPLYACLLALLEDGDPIVGVAHFPALNETIQAARGLGAHWNGRRARVSSVDRLEKAVMLASDIGGHERYGKRESFDRLIAATSIHRTWGDSYGYLLVATGRAEIMGDSKMQIWDCAPFGVILPEAGGTFTTWDGRATIDGGEAIATNGALFAAVMALTSENR